MQGATTKNRKQI